MYRRLANFLIISLVAATVAILFFGPPARLVFGPRNPDSGDRLQQALRDEMIEQDRMMAEYAAADRNALAQDGKDAAARRADEIDHEKQTWNPANITPCGTPNPASRPTICIERMGPESRQLGAAVALKLTWRNLPSSAYIRMWVRNSAPAGQRWQYAGPRGAILPDFKASSPSGTTILRWDGKSIWCAPADVPMLCDNGEVGEYGVRAAILTGTDPFWPSWPDRSPIPVQWLALSETAPIALTGMPRIFDRVPTMTFGPVNGPLKSLVPRSYLIQSHRQAKPARLGKWRDGWTAKCRTIILAEPYSGTPELCFPTGRIDRYGLKVRPQDIFAQGTIEIAPGVMPPGEARERARIAAFLRVADRARYITRFEAQKASSSGTEPNAKGPSAQWRNRAATWTNQNQVYAYFHRDERGPYWIITLDQSINTLNYEEYVTPSEALAYRVDPGGKTCLLKAVRALDDPANHRCPDDPQNRAGKPEVTGKKDGAEERLAEL